MPVHFEEKSHRYISHKGYDYISVTTLIKKYTPPFDADYWSAYKAIKEVLTSHGVWDAYRIEHGWENVVTIARADKDFKYRKEVVARKKQLLAEWEEKKNDAAEAGTSFHKLAEHHTKKSLVWEEDESIPVLGSHDLIGTTRMGNKLENGLLTELLLYDDELEIAGQADWVLVMDGTVHIKDYKTSKEIKTKAFGEEVLLHPLEEFPNCNFYTYGVQLSLYAFILERLGYKIGKLSLEHIDRSTFETIASYPVKYHREAVIKLVNHYCAGRKKTTGTIKASPASGAI
jgi:glutamate mutase epsilon subunit